MSLLHVVICHDILWYFSGISCWKNRQFMADFLMYAPPAGAATLVWFFTASAAALISSRLPQERRKTQQLFSPTPGDCDMFFVKACLFKKHMCHHVPIFFCQTRCPNTCQRSRVQWPHYMRVASNPAGRRFVRFRHQQHSNSFIKMPTIICF